MRSYQDHWPGLKVRVYLPAAAVRRNLRKHLSPNNAANRSMRYTLFLLLIWAVLGAIPCSAQIDKEIVRGITISTHGNGRDWGSDAMGPTMEEIRALGANWVSIHPYARIREDGSLRFDLFDPSDPPAYLTHPIREAHRLGLSICIKPHIAYWGSPFSWRGEIEFSEAEQWDRFWRDYGAWIVQLAAACHLADGFVVGTELDRTVHFEAEWRSLIADVRAQTDAPLTYAANWTDYGRVPFWDALDVIGIQAYFPLTDKPSYDLEEIERGWARRMEELRAFSTPLNRRVLFTELGYNQSHQAAVTPWAYAVDGDDARPLQTACMRTALRAIEEADHVVGALLWKWFPQPRPVGRNFQLAAPHMRQTIAEQWQVRASE